MKRVYVIPFRKKTLFLLISALVGVLLLTVAIFVLIPDFSSNPYSTAVVSGSDQSRKDQEEKGGLLAIIIDDFGSDRGGIEEMMAIQKNLTFAIMPFLENTHKDAERAIEEGFEVIVHLSLEPNHGKISWLGPHPIMAGMEPHEVKEIVKKAFNDIPQAVGVNIHMGSKASSREEIVSAILDVVLEKQKYFVDSRTAEHPIGKKIAEQKGVLAYDRDVFLDGQQPKSFVKKRLREAGDIALKKGYAIAIGHVGIEGGKVTAQAILEMIPEFDDKNIRLVFVSQLQEYLK